MRKFQIKIYGNISSDRKYGRAYINDIDSYRSIYSKKNYQKILLDFINISRRIEKILSKFKPNVVYISNGLSGIEVSILNVLAKKYGAKVLVPHPTMYKNYFFFANDIYLYDNKIYNYYKKIKNNSFSKNINNLYKETQKKGVVSLDRDTIRKQISIMKKRNILNLLIGDNLNTIIKNIFFQLIFILGFRFNHLKLLKNYNFLWKIKMKFN